MNLLLIYFVCFIILCIVFDKTSISSARSGHRFKIHDLTFRGRQQRSERRDNKSWLEKRVKQLSPINCGLKLTKNYIIGGEEAVEHEYPFIVSLQEDFWGHWCGGAVITDRWILTAGHCVSGMAEEYEKTGKVPGKEVRIMAGAHQYTNGDIYHVSRVILHRRYSEGFYKHKPQYDIALLKTDRKIRFNSAVNAICLPTQQYSEPYGVLTVAGWGQKRGERTTSLVLRKVNLNIVSHKKCSNMYANPTLGDHSWPMFRQYLCASAVGKSTCHSDSGSPAFQYYNGRAHIIGIVAFGVDTGNTKQCLSDIFPNGFTKVSYFLNWILSNIDSNY